MQPVTTSNIQTQITPTLQKKPSEQNQQPAKATPNNIEGNSANLSEDIVTLSTPQIPKANFNPNIPSIPVSHEEMKALYKAFSIRV